MNLYDRFYRRLRYHLKYKGKNPIVNEFCSEFEVNNWIVSDFIVYKLLPIVGTSPFPICELNLLVSAVCRLRPTQIMEWGTNIGKSARIFYETAKAFEIPLHIHSIDLPDNMNHQEHPKHKRGLMVRGLKNVTLHQGDGLAVALEIYTKSKETSPPLILLDGDHSYESVKRELCGIFERIPSANIIIHDTFYQSANANYNIGPYKAVTEFLEANPNQFKVMSVANGMPGITLLYRL